MALISSVCSLFGHFLNHFLALFASARYGFKAVLSVMQTDSMSETCFAWGKPKTDIAKDFKFPFNDWCVGVSEPRVSFRRHSSSSTTETLRQRLRDREKLKTKDTEADRASVVGTFR